MSAKTKDIKPLTTKEKKERRKARRNAKREGKKWDCQTWIVTFRRVKTRKKK